MIEPGVFTINAILCDSAIVSEDKLYIQGGGWNVLNTATFPFRQARISIAAVVGVPYTQTNQGHTLEITLEGADGGLRVIGQGEGGDIKGVQAQFITGRPPMLQAGDAQNLSFAVNMDQIHFDGPGSYAFVLKIDGTEVERLTFRVIGPAGNILPRSRGDE